MKKSKKKEAEPLSIEDATEWAKPFGFKPSTRKCLNCGKEFTTCIPYRGKDFVGLLAPLHECGQQYRLKTMVFSNLKERREWRDTVRALSDSLKQDNS